MATDYGAGSVAEMTLLAIANNSVITLYDNTAASGTILRQITISASSSAAPVTLSMGNRQFSTGLTLVVATANSSLDIVYE